MKVSFVIPVYKKKPETFKRCLRSLFTQTYRDIEVIPVFDGPDEVLKRVLDEEVERANKKRDLAVLYHEIEHAGAPAARNKGFKESTGDVVSFWDADCVAEPMMTDVWVRYFTDCPWADFVYSGYKWNDPKAKGYDSELYDPWLITRYNYVAPMFPCKREKVVEWDESLEALQDWDYWRRIIAGGAKGLYISTQGIAYPFSTEISRSEDEISGLKKDIRGRIKRIREKYGDKENDTLVLSPNHPLEAIEIAKTMDGDFFRFPKYWVTKDDYKTIIQVGVNPTDQEFLKTYFTGNHKANLVLYWLTEDIDSIMAAVSYRSFVSFVDDLKGRKRIVQVCDSPAAKRMLERAGLAAEIISKPLKINTFDAPLPEKFKVLAWADELFTPVINSVKKALPQIEIEMAKANVNYRMEDYSVALQFAQHPTLISATRNMILAGRHVISNVREPFANCGPTTSDLNLYKTYIMAKLKEIRDKNEYNTVGQAYYRRITDSTTFAERMQQAIRKVNPVQLEVVGNV